LASFVVCRLCSINQAFNALKTGVADCRLALTNLDVFLPFCIGHIEWLRPQRAATSAHRRVRNERDTTFRGDYGPPLLDAPGRMAAKTAATHHLPTTQWTRFAAAPPDMELSFPNAALPACGNRRACLLGCSQFFPIGRMEGHYVSCTFTRLSTQFRTHTLAST